MAMTSTVAAAMMAMPAATMTTTTAMAMMMTFSFAAVATRAEVTAPVVDAERLQPATALRRELSKSQPPGGQPLPFHHKVARHQKKLPMLRDRKGRVSRIQTAPHHDAADDDDAFPGACSGGSRRACPCTACRCRRQCATPRRNGASARAWPLFPP